MDLKTTTRPNRWVTQLCDARSLLARPADGCLEVAEIGPGLAVKYLGRLCDPSTTGWGFFRRIETGIRRVPMPDMCFENYETRELIQALEGLDFNLTVMDINPKVVRVVQKRFPEEVKETVVADLGTERDLLPLYGKFDLVVALEVISRVAVIGMADRKERFENARANLTGLVKPGGLLVASGNLETGGCVRVKGRPVHTG
jgi:hypothetical protein